MRLSTVHADSMRITQIITMKKYYTILNGDNHIRVQFHLVSGQNDQNEFAVLSY